MFPDGWFSSAVLRPIGWTYISGKSLLSIIHVGFMHYSEEKVSFHLKRKRETLKQEDDSWNKIWPTLKYSARPEWISRSSVSALLHFHASLPHNVYRLLGSLTCNMLFERKCGAFVIVRLSEKYVTPLLWRWHRNFYRKPRHLWKRYKEMSWYLWRWRADLWLPLL